MRGDQNEILRLRRENETLRRDLRDSMRGKGKQLYLPRSRYWSGLCGCGHQLVMRIAVAADEDRWRPMSVECRCSMVVQLVSVPDPTVYDAIYGFVRWFVDNPVPEDPTAKRFRLLELD